MAKTKQKIDSSIPPFGIKIYPSLLEGIVEGNDLCQPFMTFVKMKIKSYDSSVKNSKQRADAKFWNSKKGQLFEFQLPFVMNVPVGYYAQIYALNGQRIAIDSLHSDRLDYDSYNHVIISEKRLPINPVPKYNRDYEKIFLSCLHNQR